MLMQMLEQQQQQQQQPPNPKKPSAAAAANIPPPLPDGSPRSVAQLYGTHWSECGYCGRDGREDRFSYGMVCPRLSALDYQALIDLGWRRSGDYLYRQDNSVSCCCNYTIRLNVRKYRKSKAQRSAMNKFERYLRGEAVSTSKDDDDDDAQEAGAKGSKKPASAAAAAMSDVPSATPAPAAPADPHAERIRGALLEALEALVRAGSLPASLAPSADAAHAKQLRVYPYVEPAAAGKKQKRQEAADKPASSGSEPGSYQWASNAALVLSGLLRKQKLQELSPVQVAQLLAQQMSKAEAAASSAADASAPIESAAQPSGHINFRIAGASALAPPPRRASVSQDRTKKTPFAPKQPAAAGASAGAPLKAHTFEVRQVPATFDERAFAVYKRYQMRVHGDAEKKLTPKQYTNFLCNSPLVSSSDKEGHLGGFHHHYLIDGRLVAVGVVDVLPSCLSSVYLFYEPDFEFLNLGTVTAVKEIEWVQQKLMPNWPGIKYYYMGYYIHSCRKMIYKGKFSPSELLCPLRFTWHDLALCRPALDSFESVRGGTAGLSSRKERCVVLSDVAPEAREEDGTKPIYLSPSMIQRKEGSAGEGANGAEKKKRKKKKKSKKAKDAAATAAAAGEGSEDDDGDEAEDSAMPDAAASATPVKAATAAPAAAAAAAGTSTSKPAASASAPGSSGGSADSGSSFPAITAASPYVFSQASLASSRAHCASVATKALPSVPVWLRGKMECYGKMSAYVQKQIQKPLQEYATLAGAEVAERVAVKFN